MLRNYKIYWSIFYDSWKRFTYSSRYPGYFREPLTFNGAPGNIHGNLTGIDSAQRRFNHWWLTLIIQPCHWFCFIKIFFICDRWIWCMYIRRYGVLSVYNFQTDPNIHEFYFLRRMFLGGLWRLCKEYDLRRRSGEENPVCKQITIGWPALGLLSWYPIFGSKHDNWYEDRVHVDCINYLTSSMSCSNLTRMRGSHDSNPSSVHQSDMSYCIVYRPHRWTTNVQTLVRDIIYLD